MTIDATVGFLRTAYEPDDHLALLLKAHDTGDTAQRIGSVTMMTDPRVQAWLRAMNAQRYSIFVAVNAIRPGRRARTKDAIGTIRHLFLDADHNASELLALVATRRDLPPPSYVVHTSPGRVHLLWRVAGFTVETIERLQRHLAKELHTDPAATPCTQTTRVPGFRNHKHGEPAAAVTVEYGTLDRYHPSDFPTPPELAPTSPLSVPSRSFLPLDVRERVRRYLASIEPAVAGQHGDLHTYRVCCRIVRGFDLSEDEAFGALLEWNTRCSPPWSEIELRRKIASARRNGREPIGALRDRPAPSQR